MIKRGVPIWIIGTAGLAVGGFCHLFWFSQSFDQLLATGGEQAFKGLSGFAIAQSVIWFLLVALTGWGLYKQTKQGSNQPILNEYDQSLKRQEALEDQDAQDDFAAAVSHELRTPLHAVLSMQELMKRGELDSTQRDYLNSASENAGILQLMVEDLLDFGALRTGNMILAESNFSIRECMQNAVKRHSIEAANKGIIISRQIDDGVAETVSGDERRLRKIISCLLNNAIKFSDSGEVAVAVKAMGQGKSGRNILEFSVTDNGPGFSTYDAEALTRSFRQADMSATRQFGGLGVGLALARRLSEAMGGSLHIDQQYLDGARVTFTVHLHTAATDTLKATQNNPTKILLVEDNLFNQKVAITIIQKLGYEVDVASDGLIAMEMVMNTPYDLIFMDLQMPGEDGITVTRRIRQAWPTGGPSIIAMTANALDNTKQECLDAGMNGFLTKPFLMEDVKSAIESGTT